MLRETEAKIPTSSSNFVDYEGKDTIQGCKEMKETRLVSLPNY